MTDFEMAKLCAEAMGIEVFHVAFLEENNGHPGLDYCLTTYGMYRPLHNDTQAMELMKRLRIDTMSLDETHWYARRPPDTNWGNDEPTLNRAVVECAAQLQASSRVASSSDTSAPCTHPTP